MYFYKLQQEDYVSLAALSQSEITELLRSPLIIVRKVIVRRAALPSTTLHALAEDSTSEIRQTLAERRDICEQLMQKLATDDDPHVRKIIASKSTLSQTLISQLMKDSHVEVILSLIDSRTLFDVETEKLFSTLILHENPNVAKQIVRSPIIPREFLLTQVLISKGTVQQLIKNRLTSKDNVSFEGMGCTV